MNTCPRGLCDGSGLLAPHPATMSADAGLDDPCPCRDVAVAIDPHRSIDDGDRTAIRRALFSVLSTGPKVRHAMIVAVDMAIATHRGAWTHCEFDAHAAPILSEIADEGPPSAEPQWALKLSSVDAAPVSVRSAAWAEVDRLEAIAAAKRIERRRAENADCDAHYDVDLLRGRTENEYGSRPVKVPT